MHGTKAADCVITALKALIFPLVYICCQMLVMFILAMFESVNMAVAGTDYIYEQVLEAIAGNTINVLLYGCVLTLLAVAVTLRAQGKPIMRELKFTAAPGGAVLLCLILGVVLNFTLGFIISALPIPVGIMDEYNGLMDTMLSGGSPLLIVLILAFIVPVTEEVVFRGMAMNTLRNAMPVLVAVLLQAVIFAVTHGNVLQMAYVFPVALIFGLIYKWSDSLPTTIAAHIGFNAFAAVAAVLPADLTGAADTVAAQPQELILYAAAGAALSAALIYAIRRTLTRARP